MVKEVLRRDIRILNNQLQSIFDTVESCKMHTIATEKIGSNIKYKILRKLETINELGRTIENSISQIVSIGLSNSPFCDKKS